MGRRRPSTRRAATATIIATVTGGAIGGPSTRPDRPHGPGGLAP